MPFAPSSVEAAALLTGSLLHSLQNAAGGQDVGSSPVRLVPGENVLPDDEAVVVDDDGGEYSPGLFSYDDRDGAAFVDDEDFQDDVAAIHRDMDISTGATKGKRKLAARDSDTVAGGTRGAAQQRKASVNLRSEHLLYMLGMFLDWVDAGGRTDVNDKISLQAKEVSKVMLEKFSVDIPWKSCMQRFTYNEKKYQDLRKEIMAIKNATGQPTFNPDKLKELEAKMSQATMQLFHKRHEKDPKYNQEARAAVVTGKVVNHNNPTPPVDTTVTPSTVPQGSVTAKALNVSKDTKGSTSDMAPPMVPDIDLTTPAVKTKSGKQTALLGNFADVLLEKLRPNDDPCVAMMKDLSSEAKQYFALKREMMLRAMPGAAAPAAAAVGAAAAAATPAAAVAADGTLGIKDDVDRLTTSVQELQNDMSGIKSLLMDIKQFMRDGP